MHDRDREHPSRYDRDLEHFREDVLAALAFIELQTQAGRRGITLAELLRRYRLGVTDPDWGHRG